ncbi:hypothetical protein [Roseibium litorale]|uniref:Uncharacterized protein n=1 Tax=Roseibium litorale TaxID=2803841 RepID=A0ABR9CI42_9HYPH|nr:hypothetical protein [Roseibium litorale]MBD8890491.1 hypothetical protein [Roseibium litorale]
MPPQVRLAASKDNQADNVPPSPSSQQDGTQEPVNGGEKPILEIVRNLDRKDQEELLTVLNQILGRS